MVYLGKFVGESDPDDEDGRIAEQASQSQLDEDAKAKSKVTDSAPWELKQGRTVKFEHKLYTLEVEVVELDQMMDF